MLHRPDVLVLAAALLGTAAAHARDVYKCTMLSGNVAYQDQPCNTDAREARIHLAPVPDARLETSAAAVPDADAIATAPRGPPRSKPPLPPLWHCSHYADGSYYYSENGNPPVQWVPAGVLGYPSMSLAQTGHAGMSAPGARAPRIDTSPQARAAADYTPVQDTCVRATPQQICAYLNQQYDDNHEKLHHAFKSEQPPLQSREDELVNQLAGC